MPVHQARVAAALALGLMLGACAGARRLPRDGYPQAYLAASHNWTFRRAYPQADRLFNAFDYGHAVLYETLLRRPRASAARLERTEYDFITRRLLRHPPAVPLEEHALAPAYATLVPEVAEMFEWAHLLHRQLYDVLADASLAPAARDAEVAAVLRYYRSRPDLAFSDRPKSMALMEGQPYSLVFRRGHPKFNGLLWSYHWLQMALYDALMAGDTPDERRANVDAAVARFWLLLEDAPTHAPSVMPMSPAVAPRFSARYPEAAIIFDNLHSLHDVVSDILADARVPANAKRATILRAAAAYRDTTTAVTTVEEWREMAAMMGVEQQGGAAPVVP